MPTKLGKGGHGPQEYVPEGNGKASGTYADDSGVNIYGSFKTFKKPANNQIGVNIKGESEPIKIKQKYDGKGKELLKDTLKNKFGKLTPNLKKLIVDIEDADDEYSGIIGDLYKNNPQLELKLGANLNSKYEKRSSYNYYTGERKRYYLVFVGKGAFDNNENYSKGGVFFHESGHALDNTYRDDLGHLGDWSFDYKSKEFDKSLSEMIYDELSQFKNPEKRKELDTMVQSSSNKLISKEWGKFEKEYNDLKEKQKKYNDLIMNDPIVKDYVKKIEVLGNEYVNIKKELSDKVNVQGLTSYEDTKDITDRLTEKQNELLNIVNKNSDYQRKLYEEKYPEQKTDSKRFDELTNIKYNLEKSAKGKLNVIYGDFSDMIEASTGKSLTNMGHSSYNNYWDSKGKNRGAEAFAEIMSASATNPESLEIMKKYIPNSLKIFNEIMGEMKK